MDEGVCAVRPGVDLGRHARMLARVHDALLSGDRPPARPRDLVERSWTRVRQYGVNPDLGDPPAPMTPDQVEQRRQASPLSRVLPQLRASLTSVAEDARHIMVITDAHGVVLWREGASRVRHRADGLGFAEGATWSEGAVGTNAIGTALAEAAPVQLFSAEHFVRRQHPWTCTACPVHDPRTGELLGVVDVTGLAETVHPTTVALVCTAVKLAESSLWHLHEGRLEALRTVGVPLLAGVAGPALVVDDHGWVAAVTGMAPVDRVAVPRADQQLAVHGVGLCEPEAVPGGWLLRAADASPGAVPRDRLRLSLELDSRPVRAVVEGTNRWLHPLSARPAELLLLLAVAGDTGTNAAELSRALYGDGAHLVTVRAELSRLRRTLGGLLLARPYRIAPGVDVRLPDLTGSAFVRNSTAPGVRALAAGGR
ncbi:MAG TPA: GAF domain-containing protein [Pseudonocardia sp.]|nr:GAF domain-containing protein [Pseudonocardia sp.]